MKLSSFGACCARSQDLILSHEAPQPLQNGLAPSSTRRSEAVDSYSLRAVLSSHSSSRLSARLSGIFYRPRTRLREELDGIIEQINKPGFFIGDLLGVEMRLTQLVRKHPDDRELYLWRGIARRISGQDGRPDLNHVLKQDPGHREALLNLAAVPLSCPGIRFEEGALGASQKLVQTYLQNHPDDVFAALIDIMLDYTANPILGSTIARLEQLYLRSRNYAACIAALASLFFLEQNFSAAISYAEEAYQKDVFNVLAHNLLWADPCGNKTPHPIEVPYDAVKGTSVLRVKNLFFMPYAQQDCHFRAESI